MPRLLQIEARLIVKSSIYALIRGENRRRICSVHGRWSVSMNANGCRSFNASRWAKFIGRRAA